MKELNIIVEITHKFNEIIWEQNSWGNNKVAQMFEELLEEELR